MLPQRTFILFCLLALPQLVATMMNWSCWPISPYNMFHTTVGKTLGTYEADLTTAHLTTRVPIGQLLPFEFFRTKNILYRVFGNTAESAQQTKTAVAHYILDRINHHAWPSFDETWASPPMSPDGPYTGIQIWRVLYDYTDRRTEVSRQLLFDTH